MSGSAGMERSRLANVAGILSVAVAQPEITPHAVADNAYQHARAIAAAAARLVVFPELSLTGYELDADPIGPDDPRLDPITDACVEAGAVALVGAPVRSGQGTHIAMIRVDARTRDVVYHKQMLGGGEPRRFSPGPGPVAIDVDGWRVGVGICKDTGSPLHIAATARLGIDLYVAGLVHLPEELAEQDARGFVLARTCESYVAFAGFAGATGDVFSRTAGNSTIWSPDGTLLGRAGDRPGDLVSANLEPSP